MNKKERLKRLEDKVFSIEANILNWQDAWVKVSNSYLKWNDVLNCVRETFKEFLTESASLGGGDQLPESFFQDLLKKLEAM